jgi:hypothetical protein
MFLNGEFDLKFDYSFANTNGEPENGFAHLALLRSLGGPPTCPKTLAGAPPSARSGTDRRVQFLMKEGGMARMVEKP